MSTLATSQNADQLTPADREKIIRGAINDVSHIATLPEITVRIMELVEDPNSTAHDLHLVISNDPALSARVLKVVNSAFYALPGQIGSINRAIVLLGLNAVKNIAIAASLAKLFRGGQLCPGFAARDLWEHSAGVGACVKLLAERTHFGLGEEAFLAGLIHDVGVMVEMQARRAKLVQVIERLGTRNAPPITFRQAEVQVFGVTHEQFGQALCEKWKFPGFLAQAAGYHHRPMRLNAEGRTMACLVHVADVIAAQQRIGYSGTVEHDTFADGVLDELKLTEQNIEQVMHDLPAAVELTAQLMG